MTIEEDLVKDAHVLMHPIRFRIIKLLAQKPMYMKEISKALEEDRQPISYHLNVLEEFGFVSSKYEISEAEQSKGKALRVFQVTDKVEKVSSGLRKGL